MITSGQTTTYTGAGQTESPQVANLDPSTLSLTSGGARVVQFYLTLKQLQQLEQNLNLAIAYYNENKVDFDFWKTTYQNHMHDALTEGMVRPFYTIGNFTPQYGALDYASSVGRGQSKASLKLDKEWFNTRRRISKYTTGLGRRADLKYATTKMNSELEGWNLGFRFEDHRKMVYDEQRHAHQAEILNLGIGAGNAVRQGLATSVQGLSEARSQKASQLASWSNGAGQFAGFQQSMQGVRNETKIQKQYGLATAGKNPQDSGGMTGSIPDVTNQQIDRASRAV